MRAYKNGEMTIWSDCCEELTDLDEWEQRDVLDISNCCKWNLGYKTYYCDTNCCARDEVIWLCPCGQQHEERPRPVPKWVCGDCNNEYSDESEAVDCCS